MLQTQAQLVTPKCQRAVSLWLIICLLLIGVMVALGGYTRLSGSGLSITEWKPIHGSIPPLNEAEWQEEFEKYQQIPQYRQVNKGMSLEEFKTIFWPEFWHRNVGRLIGIVFALPLAWFYFRPALSNRFALRLLMIFALGGLQGIMGWVMVASGLKDLVFVSHIKLAMHLGLALIIFACILWAWLDIKNIPPPSRGEEWEVRIFLIFPLLIFTQMLFGALLAGLHGGLIYNTFPLMNGALIPPETFEFEGVWLENIALIQFIHRWLAKILIVVLFLWWWFFKGCARLQTAKKWLLCLTAVLALQFLLGVLTLVNAVPLALALSHQLVGLLLFTVSVGALHALKRQQCPPTPVMTP